ncbi:MAG: hypothetical protein IPK67_19590 [Planctomycetes bacterium]|nr:hypothetical protein [Planctomycetota bacterium]
MTVSHGLLMIEPGSTNFRQPVRGGADRRRGGAGGRPTGLVRRAGRRGGVAALSGRAGGADPRRHLGAPHRVRPLGSLRRLGVSAAITAAGGLALLLAGHMEDVGFIVYFEIFPEHWHGDYQPSSLLPRVPEFYATLLRYCGGAALLAFVGLFAPPSPARRATAFLLGSSAPTADPLYGRSPPQPLFLPWSPSLGLPSPPLRRAFAGRL